MALVTRRRSITRAAASSPTSRRTDHDQSVKTVSLRDCISHLPLRLTRWSSERPIAAAVIAPLLSRRTVCQYDRCTASLAFENVTRTLLITWYRFAVGRPFALFS